VRGWPKAGPPLLMNVHGDPIGVNGIRAVSLTRQYVTDKLPKAWIRVSTLFSRTVNDTQVVSAKQGSECTANADQNSIRTRC
jgi:hypothetical protein